MQTYTTRQIAKMLQLNLKTVRRYLASKKLESIRIGNRYRVTDEQLQDFLNKNTLRKSS